MNKQQQIEEMGKVIPEKIKDPLDNSRYIIFGKSLRREIARIYYNAGYRKIDEFVECRNCTAWSGTDCTRHPYTQGCLKDENNIKRQAVKEFAEKLKYTWITDSDAYKKGCKETAEKILNETMQIPVIEGKFVKVDDLIDKLKEIATREGVEIKE